ncbi:MAG: hypothetical protein L6R41_006477 [Letrouitia leprolyta]|nr:MAG: hypothetical protein L6R41_006477 [Letrouitia leprolyta]
MPYTLFSIGMFLVFWGLCFAFYYVGSFGRDILDISQEESINNLLMINGVGLVGRLVPAHLAHRYFGPLNMIIPFVFVSGLLLFCWAAVADSHGLVIWTLFYGLFAAGIQSLFPATLSSLTTDLKKTGLKNPRRQRTSSPQRNVKWMCGINWFAFGWKIDTGWERKLFECAGVCWYCIMLRVLNLNRSKIGEDWKEVCSNGVMSISKPVSKRRTLPVIGVTWITR